jgi:signal transduction histidine kinase
MTAVLELLAQPWTILSVISLAGWGTTIALWRVAAARRASMCAERNRALAIAQNQARALSVAGHDLRQPVQALGLFVAALSHHALKPEQEQIVDKIDAAVDALERLLDTLQDFSRLESGATAAQFSPFPLTPMFNRLSMDFEPAAERKGLSCRMIGTTKTLNSDPVILETILRHLLSNAISFTLRGGVVAGCRQRGNTLRIEVWDSGIGIKEEDHQEAFREFRRLDTGLGSRMPGLGLGLAIVDRSARLLHATVELRSIPGKGSMFAIVLPSGER